MKILVPLDFSHHGDLSIEKVHVLFPKDPVEVHLLHVIDVSPIACYPESDFYFDDWEAKTRRYSDNTLESIKERCRYPNMSFQTCTVNGRTVDNILTYCKEKTIDMIIMPTHGRKPLEHFFIGSVTEKIVNLSKIPVYTFKIET